MAVPELSYRFKPIQSRAITSKETEWLNRRNKLGGTDESKHEIDLVANKDAE